MAQAVVESLFGGCKKAVFSPKAETSNPYWNKGLTPFFIAIALTVITIQKMAPLSLTILLIHPVLSKFTPTPSKHWSWSGSL